MNASAAAPYTAPGSSAGSSKPHPRTAHPSWSSPSKPDSLITATPRSRESSSRAGIRELTSSRPNALLSGFNPLHMSPIMRAPEVTAPGMWCCQAQRKYANSGAVGDIPYQSTVTEREERLPIAVSVIGAPGMYSYFRVRYMLADQRSLQGRI